MEQITRDSMVATPALIEISRQYDRMHAWSMRCTSIGMCIMLGIVALYALSQVDRTFTLWSIFITLIVSVGFSLFFSGQRRLAFTRLEEETHAEYEALRQKFEMPRDL